MKKLISLFLALTLALGCLPALGEGFAADYAAMNEAAASVLVLTLYDDKDKEIGTASGFMAFDDRHAVTTLAAVSAARIEAKTDEGEKLGGIRVLGCDSDCSLAILAFDEATGLKPLELNESGAVRRGAACVSIGAQDGVNSITTGHIATTFTVKGLDIVQFTATISEGASGGALLDENGKVAAVTMFGLSGQIGYTVVQNMNFALSARHLMTLWEFCKDDEPVELKDWGITDIGAESTYDSRPNEFYVINQSGASISQFNFYYTGVPNTIQDRLNGWVNDGETVTIKLTEADLSIEKSFDIVISISGRLISGRYSQDGWTIDMLKGKTFIVTTERGYNGYKVYFTEIEETNDPYSERRHMKEAVKTEDDFEIPEIIERERVLPGNTCIIVNDSDYIVTRITLGTDGSFTVLSEEKVGPGEICIVELPDAFVNSNGKHLWKFSVYSEHSWTPTQINTKNQDEICGKIIVYSYDEKTKQLILTVQ